MEKVKVGPEWIRPDLQEEIGEIERVIVTFLERELSLENTNAVISALESALVVDLSDEEWNLLENTDSHLGNIRPGHIEDAEENTEAKLKLHPENPHDFKNILSGFINGSKMKTPMILRNKTGRLHLISGDTRLMICQALSVRPRVVIGKIK